VLSLGLIPLFYVSAMPKECADDASKSSHTGSLSELDPLPCSMPISREAPTPDPPLPFSAGDVACLGATINTANANGEANTMTFETGTYTLTAVDNDTDGPNGRGHPRSGPEPGQLRCRPSGSHEPVLWARGGPAIKASGARVESRLEPVEG
jgi:hypothetical protein